MSVNTEKTKTIVLEITTVTRIEVPIGSSVQTNHTGNGHSGIILPDGRKLTSYLSYEIDEKEVSYEQMEAAGCYYEDISRNIEIVE